LLARERMIDRLVYAVETLDESGRIMSRRGGESGLVIYPISMRPPAENEHEPTDASPALTPCLPVSHTSRSPSTSLSPEILIASQGYERELELSIQGIESANAVKQDSSCPRIEAASSRVSMQSRMLMRRLTSTRHLECILECLGQGW
jgi:hypothetical protein